jgi:hypothetical protein
MRKGVPIGTRMRLSRGGCWRVGVLACWLAVLVWLVGCGAGAPPDRGPGPRSDIDLNRVNPDGLMFHVATPREAAALAACATWVPHTGLGAVQAPPWSRTRPHRTSPS